MTSNNSSMNCPRYTELRRQRARRVVLLWKREYARQRLRVQHLQAISQVPGDELAGM